MSGIPPQPTDEVIELVRACGRHLRTLQPDAVRKAFAPPEGGSHANDPTPSQMEAVYATASMLCDEGNFRFAAALALHLVTHQPTDPRFAFMAGTCMQHIGMHANAANFFCVALVAGGDDPATFYRLAECLVALGDRETAEKALDAAIDLSRDSEQAAQLQAVATELLDLVKRNSA